MWGVFTHQILGKKKPKFVNEPISNFQLEDWIRYLKIPNFKGIYSRDEPPRVDCSPCIINLDTMNGPGTHWVVCALGNQPDIREVWYFDSFGMFYPKEYSCNDGRNIRWNTIQYQDFSSLLCGYFCLYFLHQWSMGKSYEDVIKPLSKTDTIFNENFIIDYFS